MHNLKNIDLDIPLGKLVVVCGLSGSGKTSLVLDTLYAEGQRRYLESFAPAVRQFLPGNDKPEFDRLENLPAAIAVRRSSGIRSSKSTIGTSTEIDDYLKILFANAATLHCPGCGMPIVAHSPKTAAHWLVQQPRGRAMIVFAVAWQDPTQLAILLAELQQSGFTRMVLAGETWNFSSHQRREMVERIRQVHEGWVVVDRTFVGESSGRAIDSLETAFHWGSGQAAILVEGSPQASLSTADRESVGSGGVVSQRSMVIDGRPFSVQVFDRELTCHPCGRRFSPPEAGTFSFNSPRGACTTCEGRGEVEGDAAESWHPCPNCGGSRFCEESLAYRLGDRSIADLHGMTIDDLARWFKEPSRSSQSPRAGFEAIEAVQSRLDYLQAVGLGYLELGRALKSLSGGESTRVNLTHVLSTRLVQMLCVLDEPTVGLHPHDTDRLWTAIRSLRDRGNSLILIEHEPELLRQAEWLIEIGPGAGAAGGEVCFQGPYAQLLHAESPTGRYLSKMFSGSSAAATASPGSSTERGLPVLAACSDGAGDSADSPKLLLTGACGRNLKNLEVTFPLRCLCVVTGVSGSGKSNLVIETLVPALRRAHGDTQSRPLPYAALHGHAWIDRCVVLDASPIPQSSRSNTASYTRCFDDLRQLFAAQPEAKKLGWSIGHFSYNSPQGRCPRCLGEGRLTIDMQFLSDIESICPDCDGTGYGPAALSITYRGRSIADCLALTIEQARPFFRGQGLLQRKLGTLIDLGLGYLPLGQRLSTMSAGELQRLKLGQYLAEKGGPALMVMDEPTAGLHFADIERLVLWLRGCVQQGHSVIVIEHNLQLIGAADHVIDLGPGAGHQGGALMACGTPAEIARNPASLTGPYLAREASGIPGSLPSRD